MTDWNQTLKDARAEHPDPFNDPRRTQKGRGWKKKTPQRVPPELSDVMGRIYTSHKLERKLSAPDRVMDKAMQYHAAETSRRMARHNRTQSNPRGMFITIIVILTTCTCLSSILIAYIP